MIDILVSCEWLARHAGDPAVRVVDTRWYLLAPGKGFEEYLSGHIPGAVFMSVDRDLAAPVGSGPGRHPLPRAEAFAESLARAGIGDETYVIAYDDAGNSIAARLWWLLRYFGHDRVSLLDGGIAQWVKEGRPLEAGELQVSRLQVSSRAEPSTFKPETFQPYREWVVDQETVARLTTDPKTLIIDTRAPERYRGETEPIDPRAGHIPHARNAPLGGNLIGPDDQRFLDPAALRLRFNTLGADEAERIVVYCGSGIVACANIAALELAGFKNVYLYEGSWSDWSRNPDREAATGDSG